MKKIIFALLFLLPLQYISAQTFNYFHNDYIIDEPKMDYQTYLQMENIRKTFQFYKTKNLDSIPVQVHFVRNNDGSGQLTTLNNLQADIDTLNNYFAAINLCFYLCPQPNYIDNTALYDFDYSQELGLLMDSTKVPWALNIYYTGNVTLGSAKSMALGISLGNQYEGVIMDYELVGNIVIVHELGHVFHLWHSHGKYNWSTSDCDYASWNSPNIPDEVWCQGAVMYDDNYTTDLNSDGIPDSQQTGDNITDTHAEPNLSVDSLTVGCNYVGTLLDYYGTPYNPVVGNHMSYGPCLNHFTNDQYIKMRWAYEEYGMKWNCGGCSGNINKIVSNNLNTGKGSLRWAVDCANCSNSDKTITFNIPNTTSKTIILGSALQGIKSNVIINGSTQPDSIVTLDGSNLQNEYDNGFFIDGDNVEINQIKLNNFPGHGINNHYGHSGLFVRNCSITNTAYQGIYNNNAANAVFHNNTITHSDYNGIMLMKCNNNTITGNTLSNNAYHGIYTDSCFNITIGDAGITNANTITQNTYDGIFLYNLSNGINIYNNFIGTNVAGNAGLGNGSHGINVYKSHNINIGAVGKGNVISGNVYDGIMIYDASHDVSIVGNKIGVAPDGTGALANASTGIIVVDAFGVTIGGEQENEQNILANNPTNVYLMDSAQQVLMKCNSMYCSNWAVYFVAPNNAGMLKPIITNVPDNYLVQGSCMSSAVIWVYKSDANCSSCEGKIFLGKAMASGNTWQLSTTTPLYDGDKITAMAEVNGISSMFADCYIVNGLQILNTAANNNNILLFPNPAMEVLHIYFPNDSDDLIVCANITNILGFKYNCQLQQISKNRYSIDLSEFVSGVYQLTINYKEKIFIKHVIIQK